MADTLAIDERRHPGNPGKRPATYLKAHERDHLIGLAESPRDRAILTLFCYTGLRRNELRMLDRADVDLVQRRVYVWHGKGGKKRVVPLNARAVDALRAYLATRPDDEAPLFLSQRRQRLGLTTLWHLLNRYSERAGLDKRVRLHSLRHTFAMSVKNSGTDLHTLQQLMGHSRLETTATYLHFDDDAAERAVDKL